MSDYTLIFIFSQDLEDVVLIRKNRPLWCKGKLNGLGGKLNEDEENFAGAAREVMEESSLFIAPSQFLTYYMGTKQLYVFWCYMTPGEAPVTMTDEEVGIYTVSKLKREEMSRDCYELMHLARNAAERNLKL